MNKVTVTRPLNIKKPKAPLWRYIYDIIAVIPIILLGIVFINDFAKYLGVQ